MISRPVRTKSGYLVLMFLVLMFHVEHFCRPIPFGGKSPHSVAALAVEAKQDDDAEDDRSEKYLYDVIVEDFLVGVRRVGNI